MITSSAAPRISVIVPNFNHARFLSSRLESIRRQVHQPSEIILLDDCSTDGSREILRSFASQTGATLILNEQNTGNPFVQWQRAARQAIHPFIWIAESDDVADPHFLSKLLPEFIINPKVGLCYCQSDVISESGAFQGTCLSLTDDIDAQKWTQNYVNSGAHEVANFLVRRNTIPNASAVVVDRIHFLEAVVGADQHRLAGDWWTWARVLYRSDIAFLAQPLNQFRNHGSSVRSTTKLAAACVGDLQVSAYLCDESKVSLRIRKQVLNDRLILINRCLATTEEDLPADWYAALNHYSVRIHPSGKRKLLYLYLKRRLRNLKRHVID